MSMEWMMPQHTGPRSQFLDQWQDYAAKVADYPPHALAKVGDVAAEVIASTENLKRAWDHLAKFGGAAAGPNRKSFSDFTRVGAWAEIERLHHELTEGNYRHGGVLHVRVPKRPGSSGTRPLALSNIQDRVIGRAIVQVLEPLFASRFDARSFCRSGLGAWHALAHARQIATAEDRWIWIAEDISGAFDNVPLERLFGVFEASIPSSRLLDLIRRSVDDRRALALWQGAPLSPLLMNVYLDAVVDRPWRRLHPDVPLLRYLDDILILCGEQDDAEHLYRDLKAMVEAAQLKLKHGYLYGVHPMSEKTVTWLGYRLHRGTEGLEIRLPFTESSQDGTNWRKYLAERFVELHREPDAATAANQLIDGIIAWAGPALPWTHTRAAYDVLRRAARSAAFEEVASYSHAIRKWLAHHERWVEHCEQLAETEHREVYTLPIYEGRTCGPDQAPWEVPAVEVVTG